MKVLKKSVLFLVVSFFIAGCASIARIEDLPKSYELINYNDVEKSEYGYYEHIFKLENITDGHFYSAAMKGLTTNGFSIVEINKDDRVLTAKRGLRANEWGSVVGIYSKRTDSDLEIKVIVKITQDFTGTMPQSYAKNIANRIKNSL